MTESIFAASIDIYPYVRKGQFIFHILLIQYWDLLLVCLDSPEQINMNELNKINVFMDVEAHTKNQIHTAAYWWDIAISFFGITAPTWIDWITLIDVYPHPKS